MLRVSMTALGVVLLAGAAQAQDRWDGADDLAVNPLGCAADAALVFAAKEYDEALVILDDEVIPALTEVLGPDHQATQKIKSVAAQIRRKQAQAMRPQTSSADTTRMETLMKQTIAAMLAGDFEKAPPVRPP